MRATMDLPGPCTCAARCMRFVLFGGFESMVRHHAVWRQLGWIRSTPKEWSAGGMRSEGGSPDPQNRYCRCWAVRLAQAPKACHQAASRSLPMGEIFETWIEYPST
jgi:hypothetical protein